MARRGLPLLGLLLALLLPAGCGGERPSWTPLEADALSTAQMRQRKRAFAARDAMFSRLSAALQEALRERGAADAIGVCREAAPEIAGEVAAEHDVAIGRTSFRLRNPDNVPPAWAEPYVEARRAENAYVAHEDGRLGALLPIRLQNPCLRCHGPEDRIDEAVRARVAEHYPDDEATGFAAGDLRGWFWIEVPPAAAGYGAPAK